MAREGVDVMCLVATLTDTPAMARAGIAANADPEFAPMDPDDVARDGLNNLGLHPVWYAAGAAAADAMRQTPREALTDSMSRTSAKLWGKSV